jgi:hypothetical protein
MEQEHLLVLFSDVYPIEDLSNTLKEEISSEQIMTLEFNTVIEKFFSSTDDDDIILKSLLESKPMTFLVAYLIAHYTTKDNHNIHKQVGEKAHSIMYDFAILNKNTIDISTLQLLLSKNRVEDVSKIDYSNGQLSIPVANCIDDMAGNVQSFSDFRAILQPEYLEKKIDAWVHDSRLDLNRISYIFFKTNPEFLERGDEFIALIEEYDRDIRKKIYDQIPFEDKVTYLRFSIIYKALKAANLLDEEVTTTKIRKALDRYKPENEREKKHIAFLLNDNASERTLARLKKKHVDAKGAIHQVLSSPLLIKRVRVYKSKWLKYVVFPKSNKFKLEVFEDLDRLMIFPCFKKLFEVRNGPHEVLCGLFSVLLWFYTKSDCHYILKEIICFEKYDYAKTDQQLSSLLEDGETPKYMYGPTKLEPYCVEYKNCSGCWLSNLEFPDRYYEKKTEREVMNNLR